MGHTHRYQLGLKKKNQVKSPSIWSRVPETGSDPPIGSDRDSGCDTYNVKHLTCIIFYSSGLQNIYKLHIWKCSTFTIFTLVTKFHIQNRPKGLPVGTY